MRQRTKGKLTARQKRSYHTYRRPERRVTVVVDGAPWFPNHARMSEPVEVRESVKLTAGNSKGKGVPMPLGLMGFFGLLLRRR